MTTTNSSKLADIGVTGLAVMGSNLARNFARNGFVTAVHNRSFAKTKALMTEHDSDGTFVPSSTAAEFVASLAVPRKILIMVKAGGPTDAVIDELAALVEPGDIIIDGGNAKFADTRRRQAALQDKGIHFVGMRGLRRRRGRVERSVASCPAARRSRTRSSGRSWRRSPRMSTAAVLHAHRHRRRRALRQDGAQRHRVRRHAADRRGLRPAAPRSPA